MKPLLGVILGGALLVGCSTHREVVVSESGEVIVPEAPPAPKHETVATAPSPSHVWVPGYWIYRNSRYVWIPGHYELRPRATAVWVPGQWDHTSRGWVWTPGRWQ